MKRRGSVYFLYDGTSLGYARAFRKNRELWDEKIYPEIERRLPEVWGYSSADEIPDDEIPDDIDENAIKSELDSEIDN